MMACEYQFDGLVGNTHHYAGLAIGDLASERNAFSVSNPKQAALQGLEKMRLVSQLGVKQALLPPQKRPHIPFLRRIGFSGSDEQVLTRAFKDAPRVFAAAYSASSMWTANAGTIAPSADTRDGKVHITASNLHSHLHRSLETDFTEKVLKRIFSDPHYFTHHTPLPNVNWFGDEGAANHTRFCTEHGKSGIQLFVYGTHCLDAKTPEPQRFFARQTDLASQAIARLHQLDQTQVVFAKQNPMAIDAGVFHNDVISVGNQSVFLYHEAAFLETEALIETLQQKCSNFTPLCIKTSELSLSDAVNSYLFNSQLLTLDNGDMTLIAPIECQEIPAVARVVERIIADDNPVKTVHYIDCKQSMCNGGGPACLRLRVVLTDDEVAHSHQGIYFSDDLYQKLVQWVHQYYRDTLTIADLLDPLLLIETNAALDALSTLLDLKGIYE